jgi:hypothetical protein
LLEFVAAQQKSHGIFESNEIRNLFSAHAKFRPSFPLVSALRRKLAPRSIDILGVNSVYKALAG